MKFFSSAILLFGLILTVYAEPVRVEVYPISQAYVDVSRGDTLGEIVSHLLVVNASARKQLMHDIVELNPHAFIDNDPNKLRANVRLGLPGQMSAMQRPRDSRKYRISEFSWGYIQQAK